jgi:putative oxidoreductase
VTVVSRILLGIIFVVFGLNGLHRFLPLPPFPPLAEQFYGAIVASHYSIVVFGLQVIIGIMLLVNVYVPLALILLAPIIVNVFFFHALMFPAGLPAPLLVIVLWSIVAASHRRVYDPMLKRSAA